jgi:dephospho-CoA kinase
MIIGITGGIGSGKSTVMRYIKEHYSVYPILADDVARRLQKRGGGLLEAIADTFGQTVLGADGELNRAALADLVFADEAKRLQLNALVHPAVRTRIEELIQEHAPQYTHIAIEAALLIEEHYEEICDELWYVDAPDEVRIQRLMQSRGYTREKCQAVIGQQLSREAFLQNVDRVIDNNGSKEYLRQQLDDLLAER